MLAVSVSKADVTVGALNDSLDLGAVLVVVAQGRQRDLRLARLTIAEDQQALCRDTRSGSTSPRRAVAGSAESRACSAARMVSRGDSLLGSRFVSHSMQRRRQSWKIAFG